MSVEIEKKKKVQTEIGFFLELAVTTMENETEFGINSTFFMSVC
jgi:hypothetical protein